MSRWRSESPRGRFPGACIAIVASEFNRPISLALVRGAVETLRRAGIAQRRIRVLWAPGAFELPSVAAIAARAKPKPHAIVAVGALIRGATPQYEVIAHAAAQGLSRVGLDAGIPVTFGVIVANTAAQAKARAGLPASGRRRQAGGPLVNRGAEAAMAALAVLKTGRSHA